VQKPAHSAEFCTNTTSGEATVIEQIARHQLGLFTREQARQAGVSDDQLQRRVDAGRYLRVRRGVLAVAAVPPSWEQSVLAAVLAGGDGALASHTTAARLHGLSDGCVGSAVLEVVAPLAHQMRQPGVRGHRSGLLFDPDRTVVSSVPCTAPARTLIDLSGSLNAIDLGRLADRLVRERRMTWIELVTAIPRFGIAPGRSPKVLLQVLRDRWPGYDPGDSEFETRVLRIIHAAGLPLPAQQYVVSAGGHDYRLDLAYPDRLVGFELDGWTDHGHRTAFDSDRRRNNLIALQAWRLFHLTWRMDDSEILATVQAARDAFVQNSAV
jgi:hypothetical protein